MSKLTRKSPQSNLEKIKSYLSSRKNAVSAKGVSDGTKIPLGVVKYTLSINQKVFKRSGLGVRNYPYLYEIRNQQT